MSLDDKRHSHTKVLLSYYLHTTELYDLLSLHFPALQEILTYTLYLYVVK